MGGSCFVATYIVLQPYKNVLRLLHALRLEVREYVELAAHNIMRDPVPTAAVDSDDVPNI